MKTRLLFLTIFMMVIICMASLAQESRVFNADQKTDTIKAIMGNKKEIIYRVIDAKVPRLEFVSIRSESAADNGEIKWDDIPPVGDLPNLVLGERTVKDSFLFAFTPKDAGSYITMFRSCDKSRGAAAKGCSDIKPTVLIVDYPTFLDPYVFEDLSTNQIMEKEEYELNLSVYGFPDSSRYEISIVSPEGKKTQSGNILKITRGDYAKDTKLTISVLFDKNPIKFYDTTSRRLTDFIETTIQPRGVAFAWDYPQDSKIQCSKEIGFKAAKGRMFSTADDLRASEVKVTFKDTKNQLKSGKVKKEKTHFSIPLEGCEELGKDGNKVEITLKFTGVKDPKKRTFRIIPDNK
jgi:hypothetical protein